MKAVSLARSVEEKHTASHSAKSEEYSIANATAADVGTWRILRSNGQGGRLLRLQLTADTL